LRLGQFGIGMGFPDGIPLSMKISAIAFAARHHLGVKHGAISSTALGSHIGKIIEVRSHEQMRRIYARWIVATVANQFSQWVRPRGYEKRYAVRAITLSGKNPVPLGGQGATPEPAIIRPSFLDFLPKPRTESFGQNGQRFNGHDAHK